MASNFDEQILNAFLDELVGEHQPPDLTEVILRKSKNLSRADVNLLNIDSLETNSINPETQSAIQVDGSLKSTDKKVAPQAASKNNNQRFTFKGQEAPKELSPQIRTATPATRSGVGHTAKPQSSKRVTWGLAIAAAVLIAASFSIILIVANLGGGINNGGATVVHDTADDSSKKNSLEDRVVEDKSTNVLPFDPFEASTRDTVDFDPNNVPDKAIANQPTPDSNNVLANVPVLNPGEIILPPAFEPVRDSNAEVASARQMVDRIDQLIEQQWQKINLKPANSLVDDAWLLRVTNRLIGETPSAAEIQILQNKLADEGRQSLVEHLMRGEDYRDRYLDHWSHLFAMKLVGLRSDIPVDGNEDIVALESFLRQSMVDEKPWDQIAYELVSAVGSLNQERDDYNPATGYLSFMAKRLGVERNYWTSHISETFLNQNSRCSQCHSSIDGQMAQREFFELHSYLTQTQFVRDRDESVLLANLDYLPKGRDSLEEAALAFEEEGSTAEAFPTFNQKPASSRSGLVKQFDRRTELANQIATSEQWRRALVNHVWMLLLNSPLETGHSADSPLKQLEQELVEQVAVNNYNIERMIESVLLSSVFDLSVDSDRSRIADNPILGTPASFSHFYNYDTSFRRAEDALAIVEKAYQSPASDLLAMRGVLAQRTVGGSNSNSEVNLIKEGLPEKQAAWAQGPRNSEVLQRIVDSKMSDDEKIAHLIVAALKRPASKAELEKAEAILKAAVDKQQAFQDIWWALFNSFEFTWVDGIR